MSANNLYLDAIRKKTIDRTPVWIMRQAGRYLPEYQKVRKRYDFLTVCKTPELATEVTLQPIKRFGLDAAILFSDILVVPEALGQHLEFLEDFGPILSPQILDEKTISELDITGLEQNLDYVAAAIKSVRSELNGSAPLIGFSGSPFTLAVYMVEGKPTRNFKFIKKLLYSQPDRLTDLLELLTEAVNRYLRMQIEAGVQAIQIFDTWGGILPVHLYSEFSGNFMKRIVANLNGSGIPVTLFTKGGIDCIKQLADAGADMLGVDWMTDMQMAKSIIHPVAALQGNLDPTVLYGTRSVIREEVEKILNVFGGESGHVFNLGHGILADIPVDNVSYLVDTVNVLSSEMHRRDN
jgi:uroporphyrinogen decarboxylase